MSHQFNLIKLCHIFCAIVSSQTHISKRKKRRERQARQAEDHVRKVIWQDAILQVLLEGIKMILGEKSQFSIVQSSDY